MGLIPRQTESNANPKKGNSKSPKCWKEHFIPKYAASTMGFVQAYTPLDRTHQTKWPGKKPRLLENSQCHFLCLSKLAILPLPLILRTVHVLDKRYLSDPSFSCQSTSEMCFSATKFLSHLLTQPCLRLLKAGKRLGYSRIIEIRLLVYHFFFQKSQFRSIQQKY